VPVQSPDVSGEFDGLSRRMKAGVARGLKRIGQTVCARAKWYAPKSPTRAMLRKIYRFGSRGGGKNRPRPGGLMRSIDWVSNEHSVSVFVGQNSEASKYAKRIHDEKGLTWWNRGPGTIAKGPQADHLFIDRAANDEAENNLKVMDEEMERAKA
jgi:hypothetical protein